MGTDLLPRGVRVETDMEGRPMYSFPCEMGAQAVVGGVLAIVISIAIGVVPSVILVLAAFQQQLYGLLVVVPAFLAVPVIGVIVGLKLIIGRRELVIGTEEIWLRTVVGTLSRTRTARRPEHGSVERHHVGSSAWTGQAGVDDPFLLVIVAKDDEDEAQRFSLVAHLLPMLRKRTGSHLLMTCPAGTRCDALIRRLEVDLGFVEGRSAPGPTTA